MEYSYNKEGYLASMTDPNGNVSLYDYDVNGNLISQTDAAGNVWQYRYNHKGQCNRVIDPLEHAQSYRYNRQGLLAAAYGVDGQSQRFEYDAQHRLRVSMDALRHTQRYDYNASDQLIHHTDAAGYQHQLYYDQQQCLIQVDNSDQLSQHYRYDVERNLTLTQDTDGHQTHAHYGAFDLLVSNTDANGNTYQYDYDKDSLKIKTVTNPNGEVYRYDYNANNQVIKTTDYSGIETTYRYNKAGRCIAKINAMGQMTQYAYDPNGNLIQKITDDEQLTRYDYDELNRLIFVDAGERSQHGFNYDALGRLTQETHNGETIQHHYDGNGQRIKRVIKPSPWTPDANDYVTDYAYDARGQLTELHLPHAKPYHLRYDERGLTAHKQSGEGHGFQLHQQFTASGLLRAQTAGHYVHTSLDKQGHAPTVFTDHVQRSLVYDNRQNPISIQDQHWGETRFNYDANSQIQTAQHPSHDEHYHYGKAQEIIRKNIDTQHGDATHAAIHNITVKDSQQPYQYRAGRVNERKLSATESIVWIYDELGRVSEKIEKQHGFRDRTTQYFWNSDDQLTKVHTSNDQIWMYQYDAFGRRITKFNPKTKESIHTLWDGDIIAREVKLHPESQFQEKQKTSTEYWHYQQDSFEPIAKQVETQDKYKPSEIMHHTYFTVTNHIGSPRELFTEDGELAWQGYYETWGKVHTKNTQHETECNLRYAGQYFDKESGLHYNRHRYYDPISSQYLSPDPIGLSGGLTPQSYVHNPNGWIDPLGLNLCKGQFANKELLDQHYVKHGKEFNASSADEYLEVGQDIIKNGHPVEYFYKPANEMRTGYISFMRNKKKTGEALFGFVGTNKAGDITTIHTKSRTDLFKLIGDKAQSKLKNFRTDTIGPNPQTGWKYPYN